MRSFIFIPLLMSLSQAGGIRSGYTGPIPAARPGTAYRVAAKRLRAILNEAIVGQVPLASHQYNQQNTATVIDNTSVDNLTNNKFKAIVKRGIIKALPNCFGPRRRI